MTAKKPRRLIYPFATSVLFAGSFVAAKYTTLELLPLTTTLLRYIVAFLFLSILLWRYKVSSLRVDPSDLVKLSLLGLFGIVGYHYFFFSALHFTAITNTAIINAFSPIATAIAAGIFIREKLSRKNYVGVALGVVGVALLVSRGAIQPLRAFRFNHGDLLMLAAVVSWVAYAVLIRKLVTRYSAFTLTYYAILTAIVMLLPLAWREGLTEQLPTISRPSIFGILYMGIFASGIGYFLYNFSIKEIGPTKTSSLVSSLVPISVAILAWLFFQEAITAVMIFSTMLIILGLRFMLSSRQNLCIKRLALECKKA
ncbi:MAG: DMT family transporter [bacterium]